MMTSVILPPRAPARMPYHSIQRTLSYIGQPKPFFAEDLFIEASWQVGLEARRVCRCQPEGRASRSSRGLSSGII